jgi:photosystem II stability/assembly factor-like uncharacterized protein
MMVAVDSHGRLLQAYGQVAASRGSHSGGGFERVEAMEQAEAGEQWQRQRGPRQHAAAEKRRGDAGAH